jgi:hypothetical protein
MAMLMNKNGSFDRLVFRFKLTRVFRVDLRASSGTSWQRNKRERPYDRHPAQENPVPVRAEHALPLYSPSVARQGEDALQTTG